jgi:hypothetical protein
LIHKGWADARDVQGLRRLDSDEDPVRLEIGDGLDDGATVIPVLLENAEMPASGDLPEGLKRLAELNARRLRDGDWAYDLGRICSELERAGFRATSAAPSPTHTEGPRRVSIKTVISYVLGIMAASASQLAEDRGTYWSAAAFGALALVLAVLAFRDYRRSKAGNKWWVIGAIVLAVYGTLADADRALDKNTPSAPP